MPEPESPPLQPTRVITTASVVLYLLLVAGGCLLLGLGGHWFIRWFDHYQTNRPRYAAERAMRALQANDPETVRSEIKALLTERPIYTSSFFNVQFSELYEGPVFRNRVQLYTDLTTRLMHAGLWNEAEKVAWKALFELHVIGRNLEWTPPWECLFYINLLKPRTEQDPLCFSSAAQLATLLAAHGMERVRTPGQMLPYAFVGTAEPYAKLPGPLISPPTGGNAAAPLIRALKQGYESESTSSLCLAAQQVRDLAATLPNPVLRRAFEEKAHAWLVAANQRDAAHEILRRRWGREPALMNTYWNTKGNLLGFPSASRDPTLLDLYWQDRPSTATLRPHLLIDSFRNDPRITIFDFSKFVQISNGYFNTVKGWQPDDLNGVMLTTNMAGALRFTSLSPIRRITLAYSASAVLGVAPILLVRLPTGDFVPLYCDAPLYLKEATPQRIPPGAEVREGLISFDCNLPAGDQELEFWFINDASFAWPVKKITEDRNLTLRRLALIHVSPQ